MFDKVALLAAGQVIVTGTKQESVEFFQRAGVYFSKYSNPADVYLRELSKPDLSALFEESRKISNAGSKPQTLSEPRMATSLNSLESEEEKSETRETEENDLENEVAVISFGDLDEIGSSRSISKWEVFCILMHRSYIEVTRNFLIFLTRFMNNLFVGLLSLAIFYDLD